MKRTGRELNAIFSVAEEMVKNNGEDCLYHDVDGDDFIIASFDGCGGSGSKKYENYSGKTGAYMASRAVCGGVRAWFYESKEEDSIKEYIKKSLSTLKEYGGGAGRIMGSLGKAFPTTVAAIYGEAEGKTLEATCFWAGDSRCYLLDETGLHQLTEDDLDGQDAMSNLVNDGIMTNVVNASTDFEVHKKKLAINGPCILLTATDGCFGYLKSPMAFEYLLTDTLVKAENLSEWKVLLNERMYEVTGDDYTLCAAVYGFDSFDKIKDSFEKRNSFVEKEYIDTEEDVNLLWDRYKKEYSLYL